MEPLTLSPAIPWHRLGDAFGPWWQRHRLVRWGYYGLCLVFVVLLSLSPWYQVVVRVGESWPHHSVFLLKLGVAVTRGDLVMFDMQDHHVANVRPHGYLRTYMTVGRRWMKRLVGLPGDKIRVVDRQVLVNGASMGTVLSQDLSGNPIAVADLPAVIPPGSVYVSLTDHPRSLDSRYIGLLKFSEIKGKVVPLL